MSLSKTTNIMSGMTCLSTEEKLDFALATISTMEAQINMLEMTVKLLTDKNDDAEPTITFIESFMESEALIEKERQVKSKVFYGIKSVIAMETIEKLWHSVDDADTLGGTHTGLLIAQWNASCKGDKIANFMKEYVSGEACDMPDEIEMALEEDCQAVRIPKRDVNVIDRYSEPVGKVIKHMDGLAYYNKEELFLRLMDEGGFDGIGAELLVAIDNEDMEFINEHVYNGCGLMWYTYLQTYGILVEGNYIQEQDEALWNQCKRYIYLHNQD